MIKDLLSNIGNQAGENQKLSLLQNGIGEEGEAANNLFAKIMSALQAGSDEKPKAGFGVVNENENLSQNPAQPENLDGSEDSAIQKKQTDLLTLSVIRVNKDFVEDPLTDEQTAEPERLSLNTDSGNEIEGMHLVKPEDQPQKLEVETPEGNLEPEGAIEPEIILAEDPLLVKSEVTTEINDPTNEDPARIPSSADLQLNENVTQFSDADLAEAELPELSAQDKSPVSQNAKSNAGTVNSAEILPTENGNTSLLESTKAVLNEQPVKANAQQKAENSTQEKTFQATNNIPKSQAVPGSAENMLQPESDVDDELILRQLNQSKPVQSQDLQQSAAVKENDSSLKKLNTELSNEERRSVVGERLAPITGSESGNRQQFSGFRQNELQVIPNAESFSNQSSQDIAFELDDQISETLKSVEISKTESSEPGIMKLGEITITNTLLRKRVLPALSATLNKAIPTAKESGQTWQKHSFDLDDGSKIELSTRNIDGVIQVKLASSNVELNRLLVQYSSEIKDHLEQECEISIDLQFENNQAGDQSGFSETNSANRSALRGVSTLNRDDNQMADNSLQTAVRKFGYNRMEWIA